MKNATLANFQNSLTILLITLVNIVYLGCGNSHLIDEEEKLEENKKIIINHIKKLVDREYFEMIGGMKGLTGKDYDTTNKNEYEEFKKAIKDYKEKNPDLYKKHENILKLLFREKLYNEFNFSSARDLLIDSFVNHQILTKVKANKIFKSDMIDYKLLIDILLPKTEVLNQLYKSILEVSETSNYRTFCNYMQQYINNGTTYDPLKDALQIQELVEWKIAEADRSENHENEVENENQNIRLNYLIDENKIITKEKEVLEKSIRGLITYIQDVYMCCTLGFIKREAQLNEEEN